MRSSRQPYALEVPTFAFAALAALAARLPLGGGREVALATFTIARLADDVRQTQLSENERHERAAGAKKWLSTLAVAEPHRRALLELIGAAEKSPPETASAVRRVIEVTGPVLDGASRSELERLARDLDAQTVAGT